MSVVAVIPARMGSKRLPGKVLSDVDGVPLVAHVAARVLEAQTIERVIVATDSQEIVNVLHGLDVDVFLSQHDHATGTDRVAEAIHGTDASIILNVQADNAYLDPEIVDSVVRCFEDPTVQVATSVCSFPEGLDPETPSLVKAVVDSTGRARYFSRAPVPHGGPWWLHIGVYGFRLHMLQQFASWDRGQIETTEELEQLRFIENDVAIHVTQVAYSGVSIDTPADLARLSSPSTLPGLPRSQRF